MLVAADLHVIERHFAQRGTHAATLAAECRQVEPPAAAFGDLARQGALGIAAVGELQLHSHSAAAADQAHAVRHAVACRCQRRNDALGAVLVGGLRHAELLRQIVQNVAHTGKLPCHHAAQLRHTPLRFERRLHMAEVLRHTALVLVAIHTQTAAAANLARHVLADPRKGRRIQLSQLFGNAFDVVLHTGDRLGGKVEPHHDAAPQALTRRGILSAEQRRRQTADLLGQKEKHRRADKALYQHRREHILPAERKTHQRVGEHKRRRTGKFPERGKHAGDQSAERKTAAEIAQPRIGKAEHRAGADARHRAAADTAPACADEYHRSTHADSTTPALSCRV